MNTFLAISCVIVVSLLMVGTYHESESVRGVVITIGLIISLLVGMYIMTLDDSPHAIDVYRDRTELQITYKVVGNDTTTKDTTVVYKPEFRKDK